MTIDNQQLTEVTLGVCETMLGLDIHPRSPLPTAWERAIQATIRVSGDWNAILEFSCTQEAAQQIASAMFAMETDELTETEITDAVAEIANMIGGNIKGMVGGDSNLSLPCVDPQPKPLAASTDGMTDVSFCLPNADMHVRLRNTSFANRECATT